MVLTSSRCNPEYQAGPGTSSAARRSPRAVRQKLPDQFTLCDVHRFPQPGCRTCLPEIPAVHEQERSVLLRIICLELEAHEYVCIPREVEVERRREEPDTRAATGEALGQIALGPAADVESG